MGCDACGKPSVSSFPNYCKEHFIINFEKKVRFTIERYRLLSKKDRVAVAVSGGKDSMSLLHILDKFGYSVSAISVDEGISGYRDKTLEHMKRFCRKRGIDYQIISFKEKMGETLDSIVKKKGILPCSVCGVFRRRIINSLSLGFGVVATGHNLDDECQAIIMNLLKTNVSLLSRLGPISGGGKNKVFSKRVKPFYLCSEKEIMIYAFLNNLNCEFKECPHVGKSFRLKVRDILNDLEIKCPGTKKSIVDSFLRLNFKKDNEKKQRFCKICCEPSSKEVCASCYFIKTLKTTTI